MGKLCIVMHHIALCTLMHCTRMPFAHVWLIFLMGHVYAELELDVLTEQVHVKYFNNLVDSRQAPTRLTNALMF
jgi:hypothetical protein